MRLIDADELEMINWTFSKPPFSRKKVQKMIDMARTIDAVPVRHGRWTVTPVCIKCSECGEIFPFVPQNYCPNCGARMDAE